MEFLFAVHPFIPIVFFLLILIFIYMRTKEQIVRINKLLILPGILFLFTIYRFFVGIPPTVFNINFYVTGLLAGACFWYSRALKQEIIADKKKKIIKIPKDRGVVALFALVFLITYLRIYAKSMHITVLQNTETIYFFDVLCGLAAGSRLGQKWGYFHNYRLKEHTDLQEESIR